jgi:anti-sigma regulatory factor (Ser/Thr protein kinase)
MAVDEACSNIIRHAGGDPHKPVRLEMKRLRDRARFILRDYGKPFDAAKLEPRDPQIVRPGGYGVFIIREVFDIVTYAPQARGTRLTLEKLLPLSKSQSCF